MKNRTNTTTPLLGPALSLLLVSAACERIEPIEPAIAVERSAASLTCRGCDDLYVVAHQDDDLLFMNPDIQNSIRAGNVVRTLYVTNGQGGAGLPFVTVRENGVRAAYAVMAGVPNVWTDELLSVNGHLIRASRLAGSNVSLNFLRLPTSDKAANLLTLWELSSPSITSDDGANTFTRDDLIATMAAFMAIGPAQRVSTLNSTGTDSADHVDHLYAARFAQAAHEALTTPHALSIYVGYATRSMLSNLHADEIEEKEAAFAAYAAFDYFIGTSLPCTPGASSAYCEWLGRQYSFSSDPDGPGRLGVSDSRCLAIDSATPYSGAWLNLDSCHAAGAHRFNLQNGRIELGGYCATQVGWSVALKPCNDSMQQRFTMTNNGQIRGRLARCLEPYSSGSNVLVLIPCSSTQELTWTRQPRNPGYVSAAGQFGSTDVGTSPWYVRTFRMGDVDGDGRADACVRKNDGVYCALAGATGFGSYARFTAFYADAGGWGSDPYGTTMQLADIDSDGRADVCARGASGIFCSTSNGSAFVDTSLRTSSFSDADAWNTDPSYYRSIRLADVNGDGQTDVCGRGSQGISCALGDGAGNFGSSTLWIADFSDAWGWRNDTTGPTIQLGDLDADGRADVCGRAWFGMYCALSNGTGFERAHKWTYDYDFSNGEGWNTEASAQSLRLADIDGDGAADLCGRASNGIACATSNGGNSFGPLRMFMPRAYLNSHGWGAAAYSAAIAFGDLDGDGRDDICGPGTDRLWCSIL